MSEEPRRKLAPRFEWEHSLREGDHGLSAATVGVGMIFASYAGNGTSNVTAATVGRGCDLSERQTQHHFSLLQEAGWLKVVANAKGGNPKARAVRGLTIPPRARSGEETRTSAEARTGEAARVRLVKPPAPGKEERKEDKDSELAHGAARRAGARRQEEPQAFRALLRGTRLRGVGRVEMREIWEDDPGLAEALVTEWRERNNAGPGLLVEMIRDGHDPREDDTFDNHATSKRADGEDIAF